MQKGLGFYVYKLSEIAKELTPAMLVDLLTQIGARWVSFKIADGEHAYNQIGGNDKIMLSYVSALEDARIAVGGWAYCYPSPGCRPNIEAALYGERIQKLRLEFLDLDIEGEWKKPNLGGSIDKLLYIDASQNFPIGLCSYRFPKIHANVNWARFFKNPSLKYVSPQVYWLGSNNPAEQLAESLRQFGELTELPVVPIGSAFRQGDWQPSADQLVDFAQACKDNNLSAWGFYSLDWMLVHDRYDWLSAIAGKEITPPQPAGEPLPAFIRTTGAVNARSAPQIKDDTLVGVIHAGKKLQVLGESEAFYQVKIYVSKKFCEKVG
jgi:hypothetical protein